MITSICVFVLIPYIIAHWKQGLKKNISYGNLSKDDTSRNVKQTRKQASAGLAIIGVILFALGIYTLNNSYKNSNQNVSSNKSNTVQTSTSDINSSKGATATLAKSEQSKKDDFIKEGMYKVGTDIQPGEYKVNSPGDGYVEVADRKSVV